MLKRIYVTNHLGERVECKIDGVEAENESGLIITSIDGLGPVKATINMTEIPSADGSIYNSSRLSNRNIVLKAVFTNASSIEDSRLLAYRYFPVKKKVKLEIETDTRTGTVEGYVESNEPDIFSKQSSFQVSIICESAHFDGEEIDEDLNYIIEYPGDNNSGLEFEFVAATGVSALKVDKLAKSGNSWLSEGHAMELDMSKMTSVVPNTSPTNMPPGECGFFIDHTSIDGKTFVTPQKSDFSSCYWYDESSGRLHYYSVEYHSLFSTLRGYHSYLTSDNTWSVAEETTFETPSFSWFTNTALSFVNFILRGDGVTYALVQFHKNSNYAGVLYELHDDWSEWRIVNVDYTLNVLAANYCKACYTGDAIYMIFRIDSSSTSSTYFTYYSFASGSWQYPESLLREDPDRSTWAVKIANDFTVGSHLLRVKRNGTYSELHLIYDDTSNELTHITMSLSAPTRIWMEIGDVDISKLTQHNISRAFEFSMCESSINSELWAFGGDTLFMYTSLSRNQSVYTEYEIGVLGYNFTKFYALIHPNARNKYYLMEGYGPSGYTESPNNTKLIAGDVLAISTKTGEKGVTLTRKGSTYNVINTLKKNPTWIKLDPGENLINYQATGVDPSVPADSLISSATLKTTVQYEGM